MPEPSLEVVTALPFAWSPWSMERDMPSTARGTLLLLNAINQLETQGAHPERAEPGIERLEAKIDLMLHWLGQNLFGDIPRPEPVEMHLSATGVTWPDAQPPGIGTHVLLALYVNDALASPLHIPGRVTQSDASQVSADFLDMEDALRDAWSQWLFRRHRRAIHAARECA
jgi:hypothetical protein